MKPIVPHQIRKVFTGRIFTVTSSRSRCRAASASRRKSSGIPGSVVLIPVTDDGEIMLVRQYRHAIGRCGVGAAGGEPQARRGPEGGRDPRVPRGDRPDPRRRVEPLGAFFPTPGYCDEEMNFFRATGLREPSADDPAAQQDEDEDIEAKPFSVDAIRRMIASGEIVDLKTVAGLTLMSDNSPMPNGQPPTTVQLRVGVGS